MMQFVYFNHSSKLWDWISSSYSNALYISPSPAKADGLRTRLQHQNITTDVVTINKFLSDLILEKNVELNLKRKSELYLIFGWLRPSYFPGLSFEQFSNAYTLFSELRSFTLDLVALQPVLDTLDPEVKKAIVLFWNILESTQFHDEHSSYFELTQKLRNDDYQETRRTYVFWGFQHLNGVQIDFLKALAIRSDVVIPFPAKLKNQLKHSDWASWLQDGMSQVKTIDEDNGEELNLPYRSSNSRELSFLLKEEMRSGDQIVLGVNKINSEHLHILPTSSSRFKVNHEIVKKEINSFFNEISPMTLDEFEVHLSNKMEEAQRNHHYKEMKVIQLVQDALNLIAQMTESRPDVDRFLIRLLKEIIGLNQPRTSLTNLSFSDETIELKSFGDLDSIDPERRVIICLDERFDDIVSLGQKYSLEMMTHLSVLGPLKRSELDLEFKRWELEEIIKNGNALMFMPESLLKHSLSWSKLFEGVNLIHEDKLTLRNARAISDYFKDKVFTPFTGSYSASKIRSYQECPRKFYFNYIEKTFPDVQLSTELDPRVKGTLSHKIIELSVKNNIEDISELTKKILDEEVKDLRLKAEDYQSNLIQLTNRSSNGVAVLKRIESVLDKKIQWTMEDSFDFKLEDPFRGQIDCYAVTDDFVILLDFKSTKSAAPTLTEIRTYADLQIWTYLLGLENKGIKIREKSLIMGFVILDEPSKSVLLFSDEEASKDFKEFFSANPLKVDLIESIDEVQRILNEETSKIKADREFRALPEGPEACQFCDLSRVCMKGSQV